MQIQRCDCTLPIYYFCYIQIITITDAGMDAEE